MRLFSSQHPLAVATGAVAAGVALLVARPRAVWRWARRGLMVWQTWRHSREWLDGRAGQWSSLAKVRRAP